MIKKPKSTPKKKAPNEQTKNPKQNLTKTTPHLWKPKNPPNPPHNLLTKGNMANQKQTYGLISLRRSKLLEAPCVLISSSFLCFCIVLILFSDFLPHFFCFLRHFRKLLAVQKLYALGVVCNFICNTRW